MTATLTLKQVTQALNAWRASRTKRGPIPQDLRNMIVGLRANHLDTCIVKALGLNTAQLKSFSQGVKPETGSSEMGVKFARVSSLPTDIASNKITFHIKRPDGNAMECNVFASELKFLLEAFLCSR